jgi:methionyl-tRNA synthetase
MPDTRPSFYLTTPIYYVNARPHIGHAYSTIVADVIARRHRLLGDDTFFLTGTDEHGQKIERSAAAAGIEPQAFTDLVSAQFRSLWDRMGLTYNKFIRTTDPDHIRGVQKLFAELYQRNHIYLSSYTGQYSIGEEIFVEGPPGTIGPDGKPTETVTEENFFFKLSEYQRPLIDLIESDALAITPEARKNEVLSFLRGNLAEARAQGLEIVQSTAGFDYVKGALRDLSVSRSSFKWGVPVPEPPASATEKKHVMYVWLDALANYMTAIGYGADDDPSLTEAQRAEARATFARYWPADLHVMAKEITRQHCIYWPAFLLAAGLPLPKAITAHGWLLFDDSKMSKSKGNIVRTETILDAFGSLKPDLPKPEQDLFATDILRYFLLREIPFGKDGSFSFDSLITRYNADLANGYGNLVSRTLSLIHSHFPDGFKNIYSTRFSSVTVPDGLASVLTGQWYVGESNDNWPDDAKESTLEEDVSRRFDTFDFQLGIREIFSFIRQIDGHMSINEPWKLAKTPGPDAHRSLESVLYTAAESIRYITALLYPIMPYATARVWEQLGLGDIEQAAKSGELKDLKWGGLKPGTKLGQLAPIFPRIYEKDTPRFIQSMADAETNNAVPRPEALLKDASTPTVAAVEATDPTHPAAGPRTSVLSETNPGAQVGASAAATPTLVKTPSHTEASASGPFAASAAQSAAPDTPQIAIDDFVKIDLRVAQIVVAERIPKADKLLRIEVDLGYERRQILSGIAEWYTPEELIGRRIVVIANLAPRKMRGLESHGMLLAASHGENGKPVLATFGEEIALGSRLR